MYGGHKNPKVHPFEVHKQHRIYGGQTPRYSRIHAHQDLRERGELIRWIDLPYDAHIIFFSHEWVGWSHPDPQGVQLKTFLDVMEKLHSGKISRVEMTLFHTLMYKQNQVTTSETWKEMLETAYVWIDWSSMPQPSACPSGTSDEVKKKLETNLGKAVKSIPAYVEKADFVAIVEPECLHADRRDRITQQRAKTCYRTYRNFEFGFFFGEILKNLTHHPR